MEREPLETPRNLVALRSDSNQKESTARQGVLCSHGVGLSTTHSQEDRWDLAIRTFAR